MLLFCQKTLYLGVINKKFTVYTNKYFRVTISIRYTDDDKILVREARGRVTFPDIYKSWQELITSGRLNDSLIGIINDFRELELDVTINDVNDILELIDENFDFFKNIKIAVVVDSYKNIVFPMIVEKISKKARIKPFSTIEAAEDWVKGIIE